MSKRCEVESDHKKCWRTSCHINRQCMRDAACAPAPEPTRQENATPSDSEDVPVRGGSDIVAFLRHVGNMQADTLTTEDGIVWHPSELFNAVAEIEALRERVKELETQHERLYRLGHCGSADSFLKCDDEVKRGYFAMMVEESTDNKQLRARIEELERQRDADAETILAAQHGTDALQEQLATLCTRVEELERQVDSKEGLVCGNCINGSGWKENAVEGRYPCTCMTEAEPYQLLQEQLAAVQLQIKTLQDAMLSVLCDPEGVPCFRGSDGDRKIIAEALSTPPDTAALDKACKLYAAGVLEEMLNQQAQGSYGNLMLKTKQRVDQLRKEAGE